MGVNPKIGVVPTPPNHLLKNRVYHEKNHAFWIMLGFFPLFLERPKSSSVNFWWCDFGVFFHVGNCDWCLVSWEGGGVDMAAKNGGNIPALDMVQTPWDLMGQDVLNFSPARFVV